MLIDTHAHLTDERLDANQIIADMASDGLEKIITVGYDISTSKIGGQIAANNQNVYFSAGVHPNDCAHLSDGDLAVMATLSKDKKCVAIGEIGLDYHHDDVPPLLQQTQFIRQLQLNKQCNLPVIIHLRDAYEDMRAIAASNRDCFTAGAVMHCFSGNVDEAKFYLDLGFYLSFTGVITFDERLSDVIKYTPKDRILVETDCPYLAPKPFRGKTNRPALVTYVAQKIALLKDCTFDEVAFFTTANAYNLFTKMQNL